jgi:hypothetical protein
LTAIAVAVLMLQSGQAGSQAEKPFTVEGTWKLVEQKNGDAQEYQKQAEGTQMFKFVADGRFVWTIVREAKITAAAGGKYKFDKDKFSETIEFTGGEGQEALVGKTFDFTCKGDANTWLHVGTIKVNDQDFKIDEKWERCK